MDNNVEVVGRLIPDSGKIHQNQEVYNSCGGGIMCTIKATSYKDPPKVIVELERKSEWIKAQTE